MKVAAAILAAGRGERMRIETPKPLLPILGKPMIMFALDALKGAGIASPVVITSPALLGKLKAMLGSHVRYAVQPTPRGTGDAVSRAAKLAGKSPRLLVVNADSPLFEPSHIHRLLAAHARQRACVSFATAKVEDPSGLGRVLRDPAGHVATIVEDAEASGEVRRIEEINAGLYAFDVPAIFQLLARVSPAGAKRERHLTRAVELAIASGLTVATVAVPPETSLGVNNLAEAAAVRSVLLARKLARLMAAGVIIDDPANVYVDWDVSIGPGSRLLPGAMLTGRTLTGKECVVGPHATIDSSILGDGVHVKASWVAKSRLKNGVVVGPFANIRPGCVLGRDSHVGTHAETVRSSLGRNVNMHHFSYVGDASVGDKVNIGAGAVTANYDGKRKHRTMIGRGAFVGSGSVVVAPARIGDHAVIGAGAVVPAGRTVPARGRVAGVPARPLRKS